MHNKIPNRKYLWVTAVLWMASCGGGTTAGSDGGAPDADPACAGVTCSGHGICAAGVCECLTGYTGADCSACADGYHALGSACVADGYNPCDAVGWSTEKFNLTVLPYCLDMRDDDYLRYPDGNPVAIANGGGSVVDEPTGSYNGGHCAKIVPPVSEDYAGLGNFNFNAGVVGSQMNVRYLAYWGFDTVQTGAKLNILNDGVSTRPMVISREHRTGQNTTYPADFLIPIPSQNVNEAPTVWDPGYPNSPSFFIADASVSVSAGNYAHEWVAWEFEVITGPNPILNFYVHTRDAVIAYGPGRPYATHEWTAGEVDLVRAAVGWYWGPGWQQTAEAYVKISDVVIGNSYIGPPPGFVP